MGTLFIVSTPIGNLKDITLRALETLKSVDFILCEDTRVTKKLLSHYGISAPAMSYHQHSSEDKKEDIFQMLSQGKNLALVTDAGTPGISDPGNELIQYLLEKEPTVQVVSIPGPSALIAAAGISGFSMDRFVFLGFPPHKRKRKKFFQEVAAYEYPVVLYESPYRIMKTLGELQEVLGDASLVVYRELTKKFETIYRGSLPEVIAKLKDSKVLGEFVIVVKKD